MCHKLVQTAVGRLHFAAKMVGEAEPPSPSALALDGPWCQLAGPPGATVRSPIPTPGRFFLGGVSSFATKYFNWAFSGPFQIWHLHYFTNSWLWIDWHFREFPLWSRNPLNLSLAAERYCSLNLSLNDRFADRNGTRPHPTVFPWPPTPNASFHSGEMRLTP